VEGDAQSRFVGGVARCQTVLDLKVAQKPIERPLVGEPFIIARLSLHITPIASNSLQRRHITPNGVYFANRTYIGPAPRGGDEAGLAVARCTGSVFRASSAFLVSPAMSAA
jgi:hypothetical protein